MDHCSASLRSSLHMSLIHLAIGVMGGERDSVAIHGLWLVIGARQPLILSSTRCSKTDPDTHNSRSLCRTATCPEILLGVEMPVSLCEISRLATHLSHTHPYTIVASVLPRGERIAKRASRLYFQFVRAIPRRFLVTREQVSCA